MIFKFIAVGLGGFLGSVLRYSLTLLPISLKSQFPIKTFIVNFLGSVLLGLFSQLSTHIDGISPNLVLFLTVGLCGGFTTFSTFALESANLISMEKPLVSLIYIVSSVTVCIVGIFLGKYIIR